MNQGLLVIQDENLTEARRRQRQIPCFHERRRIHPVEGDLSSICGHEKVSYSTKSAVQAVWRHQKVIVAKRQGKSCHRNQKGCVSLKRTRSTQQSMKELEFDGRPILKGSSRDYRANEGFGRWIPERQEASPLLMAFKRITYSRHRQ